MFPADCRVQTVDDIQHAAMQHHHHVLPGMGGAMACSLPVTRSNMARKLSPFSKA